VSAEYEASVRTVHEINTKSEGLSVSEHVEVGQLVVVEEEGGQRVRTSHDAMQAHFGKQR
jgi:hypothetical protein